MPYNSVARILSTLPEVFDRDGNGTGTNKLLAEAVQVYYDQWETAIPAVGLQRFSLTCTGKMLDDRLALFGLPTSAPTEALKRQTLAQHIIKLWGGVHYDDLLYLCSVLAGIDGSDITPEENPGGEPYAIQFQLSVSGLLAQGIAAGDVAGVVSNIQDALQAAAMGGVRVTIILTGGAVYSGADTYDTAGSDYAT